MNKTERLAQWLYERFNQAAPLMAWEHAYEPLKDWYREQADDLLALDEMD
jgi:hypothetical protein